jgi:chorismate-pyruvate lyase
MSARLAPDTERLIRLFFRSPDAFGHLAAVDRAALPAPYNELLVHDQHMTVTVERFYGCEVDVRVLDVRSTDSQYARKILLARQSDGAVVQFGIARLNFAYLPEVVQREVRAQRIPLGRILIRHGMLRRVELVALWRVEPGPELRQLMALDGPATTYGRTALIHVNHEPAVELLEVVAPTGPCGVDQLV